jgi:hypothetical protein
MDFLLVDLAVMGLISMFIVLHYIIRLSKSRCAISISTADQRLYSQHRFNREILAEAGKIVNNRKKVQ